MKRNILFDIVDEKFQTNFRSEPTNKPVLIPVDITDIKETTKSVTFKCDIPDHIYNVLIDTQDKYSASKFSKRISAHTLQGLSETLTKLSNDAISAKFMQGEGIKKIILVKYSHSLMTVSNQWNSANEGLAAKIDFQFCVCFKTSGGTIFNTYKSDGTHVPAGIKMQDGFRDSSMKSYKHIEWTQEREDFLNDTQNKISKLGGMLDGFLGDLDGLKLDNLIETKSLKLIS